MLFNIKKDMAGQYRCEAAVDSDHISIKKQTVVTYNLAVNKGEAPPVYHDKSLSIFNSWVNFSYN